jgi:hypothetical protein
LPSPMTALSCSQWSSNGQDSDQITGPDFVCLFLICHGVIVRLRGTYRLINPYCGHLNDHQVSALCSGFVQGVDAIAAGLDARWDGDSRHKDVSVLGDPWSSRVTSTCGRDAGRDEE